MPCAHDLSKKVLLVMSLVGAVLVALFAALEFRIEVHRHESRPYGLSFYHRGRRDAAALALTARRSVQAAPLGAPAPAPLPSGALAPSGNESCPVLPWIEEQRRAAASSLPAGNERSGRAPLRPRIYIYDLPAWPFRHCEHCESWAQTSNYAAEVVVPQLLRQSAHFTADASEADFYWVHAYFYCARPALGDQQAAVETTLAYLRKHWPYWDRNGGRDHLWFFTQDHGRCGFAGGEQMHPALSASITLSHWGLTDREIACDFTQRALFYGCWHRRNSKYWGDHLPCFTPGQDIVVAHTAGDYDSVQHNFSAQIEPAKAHLAFFAGAARYKDPSYSHGVRQALFRLHSNHPGFHLVDLDEEGHYAAYLGDFGRATFCLALTGAGWGVRLKLAALHGCIPVVIADRVQMEFEDVLPYGDFAVRLPQHALFRLPQVLEALARQPSKVAEMQARLPCVAQFLSWRSRALEALVCSLRHRAPGSPQRLSPAPRGEPLPLTQKAARPAMDWGTCQLLCE